MRPAWSRVITGLALAAAAATVPAGAETHQTAAPPAAIDALMPDLLARTGVPSVSVARIEDGRIAWAGAWGERAPGENAALDTLYNVASLAKPVSAETVLRAASLGELDLSEPMMRYWVDPDIAADPRHRLLTPRHALTHRTGFPNWRSGELEFQADPGTVIGYSGEGFEYLARYAERKNGESFESMAARLVLDPAGMSETAYTDRAWFRGRLAAPFDNEGKALASIVSERFSASDDLHTTARDYARFLLSVARQQGLNGEIGTERGQVQASTLARTCPPEQVAACPDEAGFGLGWDVLRFGERTILWHTGEDTGAFALVYIIPQTGEGIVILTNSQKGPRIVLPLMKEAGTDPQFLAFLKATAG